MVTGAPSLVRAATVQIGEGSSRNVPAFALAFTAARNGRQGLALEQSKGTARLAALSSNRANAEYCSAETPRRYSPNGAEYGTGDPRSSATRNAQTCVAGVGVNAYVARYFVPLGVRCHICATNGSTGRRWLSPSIIASSAFVD